MRVAGFLGVRLFKGSRLPKRYRFTVVKGCSIDGASILGAYQGKIRRLFKSWR